MTNYDWRTRKHPQSKFFFEFPLPISFSQSVFSLSLHSGGSNQEISKLQTKLKFLEAKLKSVQTQLDNKTKENEELSNMMNELCGQQV